MYVTPEQIQAANKSGVETLLAAANMQFAALEKIANLSASAAKSAFEDAMNNTRAFASAKDAQELMTLQSSLAQPALEKALSYSRGVYEVAVAAGTEWAKLAEKQAAEFNETFVTALDRMTKNAPAGSDFAVATVKSMISAANTAYDNLNKSIKQASEIAEANVAAATETVKGMAKGRKTTV